MKPRRLFKYIAKGDFYASSAIPAENEHAFREYLREHWNGGAPLRGWSVWETTPRAESDLHSLLTSPAQRAYFRDA